MDLKTYLDQLPIGGRAAFAKQLGIGRVYLAQIATKYNGRQPSPALCWSIEEATGGKVTRVDLRDDATTIWPDLERRAKAR